MAQAGSFEGAELGEDLLGSAGEEVVADDGLGDSANSRQGILAREAGGDVVEEAASAAQRVLGAMPVEGLRAEHEAHALHERVRKDARDLAVVLMDDGEGPGGGQNGVRGAAGGLGRGAHLREGLGVGRWWHLDGQPAVGDSAGQPQHARAVGGQPDGRERRLGRGLQPQDGVAELPEGAVEGDWLGGRPQQAYDLDRLLESSRGAIAADAVWSEVLGLASAEAEDGPPAAEVRQAQECLRQVGRVAAERLGHGCAEADARGGRAG
jgi:hypothetical protein